MRSKIAIVFSAVLLACTVLVPTLSATENGCTLANVKGTYGYVGFGTVLAGNPFGVPPGTFSSTGTLNFDGKGNLLIIDTQRIDDLFVPPDTHYPSTYTVNKQCVVLFTITAYAQAGLPGPHFKGVFVNNRKGALAMSLLPGLIVNYVNTTKITVDGED